METFQVIQSKMFGTSIIGILHHKEIHEGQKLDIAYITPQLIASAMPTDRFLQGFYRMNGKALVQYLEAKHENHWHIWCLQEDSEMSYDIDNLGFAGISNAVTHSPIPDHRPIDFATLVSIANDVATYLKSNSKNVALVHCKCGKGRTGMICVAYLMMFHGIPYKKASDEFTRKRMRFGLVDGITIKSQQRYLKYVEKWLHLGTLSSPNNFNSNIRITHVVLRNPTLDVTELTISSLRSSDKRCINTWYEDAQEKRICLSPMQNDNGAVLPSDLYLEVKGYGVQGGYRIPMCNVSYAFNATIESELAAISQSQSLAGSPLARSSASMRSSDQFSTNSISVNSCICQWDDFDGFYGLGIKGIKAFDSLEVFFGPC